MDYKRRLDLIDKEIENLTNRHICTRTIIIETRKQLLKTKDIVGRWYNEINKSKEKPRIDITKDDCKELGYNMIFHLLLTLNKEITDISYNCFNHNIIVYLEREGDK